MDYKPKIDFSKGSFARQKINKEFYTPKWNLFRSWYFQSLSENDFDIIRNKFYSDCENYNKLISFVPWFIKTYVIDYINVIERSYKLSSGAIQKSLYPPQQSFQNREKNNKILNFTAFSKLFENDTLHVTVKHMNMIFEKINYTNLYLTILGEEFTSLHNRIERIISVINQIKSDVHIQPKEETNIVSIASSFIQPPPEINNFKFKSSISELEKYIDEKFKNFNVSTLNKELDNESSISNDKFNKVIWTDKPTHNKYYYSRLTPMDVFNEEQEYIISNNYNGKSIYEWNLDGFADKHIYNLAHRMLMYSTMCRNIGNIDKNIVKMLIAGFTGQLKGWWDNYLSIIQKDEK